VALKEEKASANKNVSRLPFIKIQKWTFVVFRPVYSVSWRAMVDDDDDNENVKMQRDENANRMSGQFVVRVMDDESEEKNAHN
jgi:hypothetical protein